MVSKQSCRHYVSYKQIPKVRGDVGICILSTSQGVLEGSQAMQKKLGGELLCLVY
jgi:small subunit ribosomal protein S8